MNQINQDLKRTLHLSDYETLVYLAVLEMVDASVSDISKTTGIARTAVYPPIQALLKRGLLSKVKIGKRIKYQAVNPGSLLSLYDRDRVVLQHTIEQLVHQITIPDQGISVRHFPGFSGMEQCANIFLDQSEEKVWKTVENADRMAKRAGEKVFDDFIERRVQKAIFARTIIPAEPNSVWIKDMLTQDEQQFRQTILVSPRTYPIEASFAVCGSQVMLLNTHGTPSGTLIQNTAIARTFETMHDLIWDRFVS